MKRNSNILWVAIPLMIVLSGAVVYRYGYLKVQAVSNEMEIAESVKSKTLRNYIALIADKPRLEAQLTALKEGRKADNAKMIEEQTAPLAAAALQSAVKEIITSRGGSISSERVEKPEDAGNFKIVTVSMDAIVPDIRALGDALHAIETQTPYFVVREMDARIRNFKEPRDLTMKLKVSGLTEGR
jgi:hypothetical protein